MKSCLRDFHIPLYSDELLKSFIFHHASSAYFVHFVKNQHCIISLAKVGCDGDFLTYKAYCENSVDYSKAILLTQLH